MSSEYHWAFIGAGTLGAKVAKEITKSGRHEIASVYVRNPEKRAAFARQYSALAAKTPEDAISAPGVDAVYIVTPHTTYYDYARLALELSKPVLCEKPVSTDAEKVRALIRLSREKGLYFAEAMWSWFSPVAQKMKQWYEAGEYGEIIRFSMNYHMKSINYAPRVSDPKLAGGALLDIGVYPITYAWRLLGRPEKVVCTGTLKGGIDTDEEITLHYPQGKKVEISTSILDFKGLERLTLEGDKAKTVLRFFHGANKVTLRRKGAKNETFRGSGSMLNEFDLAAGEIREGLTESRYVPHEATLGVMELMDECRRQMGLVYPFEKE